MTAGINGSPLGTPEIRFVGDWQTKLALSQTTNVETILKFGRNPIVGTSEEDVWSVGGKETLLTAGAAMYVSCVENISGVGQRIAVAGLDENFDRKTGYAVLTGQTQARILDEDGTEGLWTRIHRGFQSSAEPDPVGDVYIAELDGTISGGIPQAAAKIHGLISYTDAAQQTQKGIYTVPRGFTGLIYGSQAYLSGATSGSARFCEVGIETQQLSGEATIETLSWAPWRRRDEYAISTSNTSVEHTPTWPVVVPAYTNIALRAKASASCDVMASMEIIIVKNGV